MDDQNFLKLYTTAWKHVKSLISIHMMAMHGEALIIIQFWWYNFHNGFCWYCYKVPIVLSHVFSRLVLKCQQLDGYIIFHQIVKWKMAYFYKGLQTLPLICIKTRLFWTTIFQVVNTKKLENYLHSLSGKSKELNSLSKW